MYTLWLFGQEVFPGRKLPKISLRFSTPSCRASTCHSAKCKAWSKCSIGKIGGMLQNDVRGKFFLELTFHCKSLNVQLRYTSCMTGCNSIVIDRSRKLEFLQFILYGQNAPKLIYVHLNFRNFPRDDTPDPYFTKAGKKRG
jgi:hypothetical protein